MDNLALKLSIKDFAVAGDSSAFRFTSIEGGFQLMVNLRTIWSSGPRDSADPGLLTSTYTVLHGSKLKGRTRVTVLSQDSLGSLETVCRTVTRDDKVEDFIVRILMGSIYDKLQKV